MKRPTDKECLDWLDEDRTRIRDAFSGKFYSQWKVTSKKKNIRQAIAAEIKATQKKAGQRQTGAR